MAHRILVIDDDDINNSLMKFRLSEKGYDVSVAKDGQIGLEELKRKKPDLIFLDVHMPNMNGYEFMEEFKKIEGSEYIPVVMLTANDTMEDVFNLEGVRGYFVKPVKFPDIYERLVELLGKNPD